MTDQARRAAGSGLAPAPRRPPADEQAITAGIERTRAELTETIEQLAAKAQVKSQATAAARRLTGRLHDRAGEVGARAAHHGYRVGGRLARLGDQARTQVPRRVGSSARATAGQVRSHQPQVAAGGAAAAALALAAAIAARRLRH